MHRLLASLTACAALSFAQSPSDLFSKAPPAIDEALRARVSKFYQAHVEGKFRVAEQLVAEESKDVFFEAEKRRCRKFEIVRINYKEDFQSASVVTNCDTDVLIPPGGLMKVTLPMTSNWKVQAEDWVWYVPPRLTRETGFGTMSPGQGDGAPVIPSGPGAQEIFNMISTDRDSVQFNPDKGSTETITITNAMPGSVRLRLEKAPTGDLTVELDKTELKAKEQATVTIRYAPMPQQHPRGRYSHEVVQVVAEPPGKVLPLKVTFSGQ
ncbi:MAG: hypothetical protein JNK87_41555 [Bryobacterales bacterium]|nr:hypothetical protein [Bryobacterales bacterium]